VSAPDRTDRKLLRIEEVSDRTGVPLGTLRYWRWQGTGPASYKLGRRVVYDLAAVDAWLDEQRQQSHGPRPA
jgi:predicted DNA-binding transcriptional regulator AlpA